MSSLSPLLMQPLSCMFLLGQSGLGGKEARFLSPGEFPSLIPITMPSVLSKEIFSSISIKAVCVFLVSLSSPQSACSQNGWSSKETSLTKWIS